MLVGLLTELDMGIFDNSDTNHAFSQILQLEFLIEVLCAISKGCVIIGLEERDR